jgi:hypothetical protein
MRVGQLNHIVTLYTMTSATTGGDTVETWDAGVQRRAKVTQIDGTRYLAVEQLVDREVYRVELWDNTIAANVKVVFGTKTLYPIRPVLRNPDRSMRDVVTIIMATKV